MEFSWILHSLGGIFVDFSWIWSNFRGCFVDLVECSLIFRGFGLYQLAGQEQHSTQISIILSLVTAVLIGLAKGRFVLSKTARKNKARIYELEDPVHIHQIFSKPFYFLIPMMIGLGVLLRYYNEYLGGYVVVAAIYCGIGMALMPGIIFFDC